MDSDEDLAGVLWSKTRKYTFYWLFHLQLQIIIIVKVGKNHVERKGRGLLLMAPNEKQSKPQSLPMAHFWCFF